MNKEEMYKIVKPFIPKYLIAIAFGILLNALIVLSAFIPKYLLDNVIPSKNISLLAIFILGYVTFHLFRNIIAFFKEYLFSKYGYRILTDLRNEVFSSILTKFEYTTFTLEKQGYIITLFKDWLTSISWFLSNILLNTITEAILLLIGLVILAIVNQMMFMIILLTIPLYGFIYLVFNKKIRDFRMSMMGKDVEVTQKLKDALDGMKEIKIFSIEENMIQQYATSQDDFAEVGIKYASTTITYDSLANMASVIGSVVILYVGGLEVIDGTMSVGLLISLNSMIAMLYRPIERIVNFNRLYQVFKIDMGKLMQFLNQNSPCVDVSKNADYVASHQEQALMSIEGVSFSYGETEILNRVSIILQAGTSYAILGDNGSGKSTLMYLITGLLRPMQGNIFLNGINIHEDIKNSRKQIGYVVQDGIMLHDTIQQNIIFGRTETSIVLEDLLKICEVESFMIENKFNLSTVIGENGSKLSSGQKQKLSLCRALYHCPSILIVDEGTSHIDVESEKRIFVNIKRKFPDMMILMISHRESTIAMMDHYVTLKDCKDV